MKEKRFCANCGQLLPNVDLLSKVTGQKVYEFADGYYCEACAQAKVKKSRK